MLTCPIDQSELTGTVIEDIPVYRCPTCGGHWLQGGDLETLSEHHGQHDQPVITDNAIIGEGGRACPLDGNVMQASTFAEHKNLRVDRCPVCRGLWLDSDELETLLSLHPGDESSDPSLGQQAMLFLYNLTERPPLI